MIDAGRGGSIRDTRVPSSDELTDVVEELKYEDPEVDAEMRKYIEDIISLITTGNEKEDLENVNLFANTIAAQKNVTKEQAKEMLM